MVKSEFSRLPWKACTLRTVCRPMLIARLPKAGDEISSAAAVGSRSYRSAAGVVIFGESLFLPIQLFPVFDLAMQLQNRLFLTIQLSKLFIFGHPTVLKVFSLTSLISLSLPSLDGSSLCALGPMSEREGAWAELRGSALSGVGRAWSREPGSASAGLEQPRRLDCLEGEHRAVQGAWSAWRAELPTLRRARARSRGGGSGCNGTETGHWARVGQPVEQRRRGT